MYVNGVDEKVGRWVTWGDCNGVVRWPLRGFHFQAGSFMKLIVLGNFSSLSLSLENQFISGARAVPLCLYNDALWSSELQILVSDSENPRRTWVPTRFASSSHKSTVACSIVGHASCSCRVDLRPRGLLLLRKSDGQLDRDAALVACGVKCFHHCSRLVVGASPGMIWYMDHHHFRRSSPYVIRAHNLLHMCGTKIMSPLLPMHGAHGHPPLPTSLSPTTYHRPQIKKEEEKMKAHWRKRSKEKEKERENVVEEEEEGRGRTRRREGRREKFITASAKHEQVSSNLVKNRATRTTPMEDST
ncbi:hypothetical protein MUK42_36853 [Musa troglodytarum]|uniref:Uncharacterized protein n=1 Tax=Musa troglodytarum TaxID=320322 RepID=A0A9E7J914_9LILI|nr:hypothetical protein MUK42_36853 [Musa troglodytarum]